MKPNIKVILLVIFSGISTLIFSQDSKRIPEAISLHNSYQFDKAIDLYDKILEETTDSLFRIKIQDKIIQSENGANLLMFATKPLVLNSQKVGIDNFYLHLKEFGDSSWIKTPNPFVKQAIPPGIRSIATYYPRGSKTVYFSAPNKEMSWNIYFCKQINDTLWTNPELVNSNLCSNKNEIFPIISSDGKELYFASNGHPGMGGYDLFVSRWDEELRDWGAPENLGFPFSSTADDLLYYNSLTNNCSILASTRDCEADSIRIYATELQNNPIKMGISDITEIQELHKLLPYKAPEKKESTVETDNSQTSSDMDNYSHLVAEMRLLQQEIDNIVEEQNKDRELYVSLTNIDDKKLLETKIAEKEERAIVLGYDLNNAITKVQDAEMDFLTKGIIPQIIDPQVEIEKENTPQPKEYIFGKTNYRTMPVVSYEIVIPKFDYTFKILPKAQFAEDNTLPPGIVYQIQLFVVTRKATIGSLKGLSPIFVNKQKSGKYLHTVGLWRTHKDALSHLNTVRRKFPDSYIIAFKNGKPMSVRNARIAEKASPSSGNTFQIVILGYNEGMPADIISAINQNTNKEIARSIREGEVAYTVGPYNDKSEAETLLNIITALGTTSASIEETSKIPHR